MDGLFSHGILAALNGEGDENHDGFLSVAELVSYLPDAVAEYAFNAGLSQKPAVFDNGNGCLQPALVPEGVRVDLRLFGSDGREIKTWSDTSFFSDKIDPCNYRVEAQDRSYMYYPYSATISVGASKVAVSLDLKPNFGSLALSRDPSDGVDVLLNGEKRSSLSGALTVDRLKSDSWELVVSREPLCRRPK